MEAIEPHKQSVSQSRWMRALYLVFFIVAFGLGQTVLGLLTVVQFVYFLTASEPNQRLRSFGSSLAHWFGDVVRFLSFTSDVMPFPWRDWPSPDPV